MLSAYFSVAAVWMAVFELPVLLTEMVQVILVVACAQVTAEAVTVAELVRALALGSSTR